ncbi:MAG: glycosyltransferase [Bacilli bacterium]|nr:glycosyltransferase [Bacilli bacterium]
MNKNKCVIFFLGKAYSNYYYDSIVHELKSHYSLLIIPYRTQNMHVITHTFDFTNVEVTLMSFDKGDKALHRYLKETHLKIKRIILVNPRKKKVIKDIPTLVLWSNLFHPRNAIKLFKKSRKVNNYEFIGYPNVTRFLFAGVGFSKYHDNFDHKKKRNELIDRKRYYHLEEDVLEDIHLFINEDRVKERIAIFSENYLPFSSGVNILSNTLKSELEKMGKKAYVVTFRIKGVDYQDVKQEKNIIVFRSSTIPGKAARKECLLFSLAFNHMTNHVRPYNFTYIQMQTEFAIGVVALRLKKKDNIPLLYTAHTMWNDMMEKRFAKPVAATIKFFMDNLLLKKPLRQANIMTVPTEKVKKYYMTEWKQKEPIVVIPGAVNKEKFLFKEGDEEILDSLKEKYDLQDKIVLGYIGRVSKEKSIHDVLEYFEKVADEIPNLVFMIVGDGPYFKEICHLAHNSKQAHRIIITGGVPNSEMKYYYNLFDAFCTASTFETQGLTYVESMWCKTPVIARQDDCLTNFLFDGVNGCIFTDFESWKERFLKVINDKDFKEKIVNNAYETALTYDKDIWAKRMYYLYKQGELFQNKKIKEVNYEEFNALKKKREEKDNGTQR